MNSSFEPSIDYFPAPTNAEALAFWQQGQRDSNAAEQYRNTDWRKFTALVERGIAIKSAACALGTALSLRIP